MNRVEAGEKKKIEVSRNKKPRRAFYQSKYKTERKRFGNATWRNDQKGIRKDGVLAVSNEDKKTAWKIYLEKLLNT